MTTVNNKRSVYGLFKTFFTGKKKIINNQNIETIINNQNIKTIINNQNIKELVRNYLTNKTDLPKDLENIPIGGWDVSQVTDMTRLFSSERKFDEPLNNWDVSNVTNMERMFFGCTNFNHPLDNWNVSNVTNMDRMFSDCTNFNHSLDNWNVSNVTNMAAMFSGCTNFNQPLDNWNVSNVTNMDRMFMNCTNFNQPLDNWDLNNEVSTTYMFFNCPIAEEDKPIPPETIEPITDIHKVSEKINYTKLVEFLKKKVPRKMQIHLAKKFGTYINNTITKLIDGTDLTETEKNELKTNLEIIMSTRLNYLDKDDDDDDDDDDVDMSPIIRESIFYCLEYVKLQPVEFQKLYLQEFIESSVNAYPGYSDPLSCTKGILERFISVLGDICQVYLSATPNTDYKTIYDIISANPSTLIPEYIKDWYTFHSQQDKKFEATMTYEKRRNKLKKYLLDQFKDYDDKRKITELIEENISKYADNIGYEDDVFEYKGGRKIRKTRKNRKYKNRLVKTRKSKKSCKKTCKKRGGKKRNRKTKSKK